MFAANAYDAAMVLCNALSVAEAAGLQAGSEEYKQAVIDAIRNNSGDLVGITSDGYAFDEHNNPIKSAVIMRLEGGKEVYAQMF
jgi:branched-chain amino acid transport system substrate-binding protein